MEHLILYSRIMRNLHLFIILTIFVSGCSTLQKPAAEQPATPLKTSTLEELPKQSQPLIQKDKKDSKEISKQTVDKAPKEQGDIKLDTSKAGSTANTEIPLENAYPYQTANPRFSVVEKKNQNQDDKESRAETKQLLFDRVTTGYQIELQKHEKIKKYRKYYLNNLDYVERVLERSRPYLYFIVEEIDKRGLPMELALLPAIESAYLTSATSRSNAAGLWQFIPTTGRYFGLKQNWWSDQRRDVILSTKTALDYLKELNIEFNGDWYLSIAAYNGGRGTIANAIKRNQRAGKSTDYFSLKLSQETSNYVPKLIALADIVRHAHLYNLNVPEIPNFPFFAQIETPGQIDMTRLIDQTSLNKDIFYQLNAGFKRWASSPEGPHRVIVPVDSSKTVKHYFATQATKPNIRWRNHKLKRGDTLYGLSREYKVSIKAIKTINKLNSSHLRAGKTILIPLRSA